MKNFVSKYWKWILAFNLLLIVGLITVAYFGYNYWKKAENKNNLYEASMAELTVVKNDLGQQTSTIDALESAKAKDVLKIKTKDSTIAWLQDEIKEIKKKKPKVVIVAETKTKDVGTTKTNVTIDMDSKEPCSAPVYDTEWDEEWSFGTIVADEDSIYRNITSRNKYKVNDDKKKKGWFIFKRQTGTLVSWKNLNPNTETVNLAAFFVKHKSQNFVQMKPNASVGYGLISQKIDIYVGFGFTLNF